MGWYIETGEAITGKAEIIAQKYGARIIPQPTTFEEIPDDQALICVVSNAVFEAAGYCFSANEFRVFTNPTDYRPKKWLVMDKELAEELTGFNR